MIQFVDELQSCINDRVSLYIRQLKYLEKEGKITSVYTVHTFLSYIVIFSVMEF